MNAEQKEIFRDVILRTLQAAGSTGITLSTLDIAVRAASFSRATNQEIEDAVQYLIDKGFIALVPKSHSLANRVFRITAAGIDDIEQRFPST